MQRLLPACKASKKDFFFPSAKSLHPDRLLTLTPYYCSAEGNTKEFRGCWGCLFLVSPTKLHNITPSFSAETLKLSFLSNLFMCIINSTCCDILLPSSACPLQKRKKTRWREKRYIGQNNTSHKGELKIAKETNDIWVLCAIGIWGFENSLLISLGVFSSKLQNDKYLQWNGINKAMKGSKLKQYLTFLLTWTLFSRVFVSK